MATDARYKAPPIIERSLGVQFQPIAGWTSAHAGLFAREALSDSWTKFSEHPRIQDRFERFGAAREAQMPGELTFALNPRGQRVWIESDPGDRLIQIQNTRFHLNWRKRDSLEYPPYLVLRAELESYVSKFEGFLERNRIGSVVPNQWEITYIDHVPAGDGWDTPRNSNVIASVLADPLGGAASVTLDACNLTWTFALPDSVGRLTMSAKHGLDTERKRELVVLEFTARGPLEGLANLGDMLDVGHDAVNVAFERITSDAIKTKWRKA